MKKIKYVLLIISIVILDQISKILIMNNLKLGSSKTIIKKFFKLSYTHNDGAAFGVFGGKTLFIVIISLLVLAYLLFEIFKHKKRYVITDISASLMIGGLIGNLIDRLYFGYVRDFLDFHIFGFDFAVFNIGDIAIVLGAFLFIIGIFMEERHENSSR